MHGIDWNTNPMVQIINFFSVKCLLFSYPSVETYVLGAHKKHLVEKVLLSTHSICFG